MYAVALVPIRDCAYTIAQDQPVQSYRDTVRDVSRIKQMLFGGFSRCLYPLQKFDSDTERRFAVILERDCEKWFKPAKRPIQKCTTNAVASILNTCRISLRNRRLCIDD